jgi:chromosome partitioning protein
MIQAAGLIIPESQDFRLALANSLIDGTALNNWQPIVLGSHSIGTDSLQRTHMITSNYTLTQHEMKLMLRWLALGGKPDVRYHIAEALLSNHVQDQRLGYDIVLIDAPPRLSTSTIGALAAATHLVMPTVLDRLSAETAGGFLRQVWELRAKLNLGLELAGVVGTKTPARPLENKLPPIQEEALATVISGLAQWRTNGYVFKRDIQLLASVTRCAGVSNPYFAKEDKAQRMFESFGDELSERIGL